MSAQPWTVEDVGIGPAGDFKNFWFEEGVILGQESTSTTNVYSKADGGVRSQIMRTQDIWIDTKKNGEYRVCTKEPIPVRPGHEVVVVYHQEERSRATACYFYIKNTRELFSLDLSSLGKMTPGALKVMFIGPIPLVSLAGILGVESGAFDFFMHFGLWGISLLTFLAHAVSRPGTLNVFAEKNLRPYLQEGDLNANRS